MKIIILFSLNFLFAFSAYTQNKTENIIIVTLDGMRWQEVFGGVDKTLMNNKRYNQNIVSTAQNYWSDDITERRKKLFPFLWNVVAGQGQIYGNRHYHNNVNNANPYKFSYPGYNEIFTGYPDPAVNSNDKILNKNENVLEFINKQKNYEGKVAAFATWNVFPFILNKKRSNIFLNADMDSLPQRNNNLALINEMQNLTAQPIDVRPDVFTYFAAREYWKAFQPKVLYIAFDETDDYAHAGKYDQYLKSAYAADRMIENLWNLVQSSPQYKNKTTLIITCDHGRGDIKKDNWTDHGDEIPESNQIWLAVMGPDTEPLGEIKTAGQLYQKQFASTIAAFLGFQFTANHSVASPVASVFNKINNEKNIYTVKTK
ncbi:MAG: alkaline phosphatase family protein [Bacteroidota bacterium]|nr:alkaline phosphatase family protein [Bacteroidota bacterium]